MSYGLRRNDGVLIFWKVVGRASARHGFAMMQKDCGILLTALGQGTNLRRFLYGPTYRVKKRNCHTGAGRYPEVRRNRNQLNYPQPNNAAFIAVTTRAISF